MILVITGNGKGKTTSALGTALRACGWEKRVAVVFFDKGGSHYGEGNIFNFLQHLNSEKLKTQNSKLKVSYPEVFRFGLERFDPKSKSFRFDNIEEDKDEAKRALEKVRTLYDKKFENRNSKLENIKNEECGYFLIVADEIINAMNLDLIDELAVRDLLNECPKNTHLILTGRNAPDWLIEKADLVSDVQEVKHYFKDGQDAIEGLDY